MISCTLYSTLTLWQLYIACMVIKFNGWVYEWKMNAGNEESTLKDNPTNVEKCLITVSKEGLLYDY